jgi:hypothetical protein
VINEQFLTKYCLDEIPKVDKKLESIGIKVNVEELMNQK